MSYDNWKTTDPNADTLPAPEEDEESEPEDPEACPRCGCCPGDGITESCNDPTGCGYWKADDLASAHRRIDRERRLLRRPVLDD